MSRPEGWEGRLARMMEAAAGRPFVWGQHDCCLMAADAVLAVRGVDPAAGLRGTYSGPAGAREVLAGGLEEYVEGVMAEISAAEIPPMMAWRGDVALIRDARVVPSEWDGMLGVADGAGWAVLTETRGLRRLPLRAGFRAWRV